MLRLYFKKFFQGHTRSIQAKKQIMYSLVLKGMSVLIGLIYVPLILEYLDEERYGVWLTLSSVIGWASFFDMGLGNGLRNRFTQAIAKENHNLAKTYVSTTYAILGVIFSAVLILYYVINPFINWQGVLNTSKIGFDELALISVIVFTFFILRFFFNLIGSILMADQRSSANSLINTLGNVISILGILILLKTTKGSLINLSIVLSSAPVVVLIVATFCLFNKRYKIYRPSFKHIDFTKSKDLIGLGFRFFYTQIVAIVLFSSTNFLIANASSQKMVVSYNVAYKYIFVLNMIFSIILTPLWSAATDAYYKSDFNWLKKAITKLNIVAVLFSLAVILFIVISKYVYNLWIGDKVEIPFILTLLIGVYSIIQILTAPSQIFINGIGKLKLGLYLYTFQVVFFIPLAYFFGQAYGAIGILLSIIFVELPPLFFLSLQVKKIINQKAEGIWNK